ncbi:restriction endonuclease subunit S [Burkholderia multivorans]|uniref:restriction endonuclease subunit S n=1 Tax=Burkholderia multivorans TaxID=87883 RepID=UPI000D00953B|nr:restriction endonuclease subunit S [Burkholderia multivorans]PRH10392.1 restriction endonuclease subunit S [Burkholderia multivorans]
MQSEYRDTTLGAICSAQGGSIQTGPFGSQLHASDYSEHGTPVVMPADIQNGRVSTAAIARVSAEHVERLSQHKLQLNDIVFSRRGDVTRYARVTEREVGWLCGTGCLKVRVGSSSIVYPEWVAIALGQQEVKDWLVRHAVGATMPNLNTSILGAVPLSVPSLATQAALVSFFNALDDRIDLLRQTNVTLESIAQTLFKSWFIDFDPVRAKAEGREPEGMDGETAALFPDSFEESALGEIPKGWSVSTLAEHVSAERGLSYKGAGLCLAGQGVPMHNLNSVLEGGDYKYTGIKYYSGEHKERHAAISGDIIVANTEQGHNHRLIGFPAIIPSRYKRAIFSHHLYRVRLRPDTPLTTHTLYYMLMAPAVREQVIGCANGSTVNMLKVAGLEIPQFVCPSAQVARAFEVQAAVLRAQIESNIERAETLAALRDTLLPRLVSGKLRLPEAEAQLNEALA